MRDIGESVLSAQSLVETYIILFLLGVAEDIVCMFLQQEALGVFIGDLHIFRMTPL